MNIAQTQYIGHDFLRREYRHQEAWHFVFAAKKIFMRLQDALQTGFVPLIALFVMVSGVIGYVAAINFMIVSGASLKKVQNEIKIVQARVFDNEALLANARTNASFKKYERVAGMENVDRVQYVSSRASFADASVADSIR